MTGRGKGDANKPAVMNGQVCVVDVYRQVDEKIPMRVAYINWMSI